MRLQLSQLVFLLILTCLVDTKRTRGRSGAVSLWSRKRKGSTGVQVRRNRPSHPKEPVIKKTDVEQNAQLNKSPGSKADSSDVKKKTRQSPKFREKRHVNSFPGYPEFNNRNTEDYLHISDHSNDGLQRSSGFFGKHVVRGPYKVYTYYNQPKLDRAEIIVPTNVLVSCNKNAGVICTPGTTAICTQKNNILCITAMTSAFPCQDNNEKMCVNSTVTCLGGKHPQCQTHADNTTTVILTCFAIVTLKNDRNSSILNVPLTKSEDSKFCVTIIAVPEPDLAVGEVKSIDDSNYATEDNIGWNSNNLPPRGYKSNTHYVKSL